MNIFNFIRNKTKAFPTLISDFGKEQGFLILKDFISSGRIYNYIDKNELENIDKLELLKLIIETKPNSGIVGIRYLRESDRIIIAVGECFDQIKTLTDILKLPQGPEHYLERVRLRKEYIDARLKENPSEVFWDYPDYFGGKNDKKPEERHILQTLKNLKVNTNGTIVTSFNNVVGLFRDRSGPEGRRKNYIDIGNKVMDSNGVMKLRPIRRSRLVACTFVKMSNEIESLFKTNPKVNIVPDHLDMDKQNDNYLNFEWVSKETNTVRRHVATGFIKHYLISIKRGARTGEQFVVYGKSEAIKAGLGKDVLRRGMKGKIYLGVIVEIISQEEALKYERGFDDPHYFDQFRNK